MNIIELAKQAGLVRNGDIGMKRWEGPQSDSVSDQDLEKFAALVEAAARADEHKRACAFMRQMHDAYSMASYPPRGTT
jgi:hypothetical protein